MAEVRTDMSAAQARSGAGRWLAELRAKGHTPVLWEDEPGQPEVLDILAYAEDIHNGPKCSTCGKGWCWHCMRPEDVKPCTAAGPYKAEPCGCPSRACRAWHVSGGADVQGVGFTQAQAEAVARLLNAMHVAEGKP